MAVVCFPLRKLHGRIILNIEGKEWMATDDLQWQYVVLNLTKANP
jgi:hypothetical protein